jgi:hypothetical protein
MKLMIFSCGGLNNIDEETRETLVDEEDDARSIGRDRYFGPNKDIDPTRIPHKLGENSRTEAPVQITDEGVKWCGHPLSPGDRLGFIEGELGEEGIFLSHYNTHVGKQGWYWICKEDADYNIVVSPKGAILSKSQILPGQFLLRKNLSK